MSGEGSRVEGAALGEVLQRIMHLFALFGFARHLPVSGLDAFLLHSQGSVNLNKDQFFFFFFYFFAAFEMVQDFRQWHGSLPPVSVAPSLNPTCSFLFFSPGTQGLQVSGYRASDSAATAFKAQNLQAQFNQSSSTSNSGSRHAQDPPSISIMSVNLKYNNLSCFLKISLRYFMGRRAFGGHFPGEKQHLVY